MAIVVHPSGWNHRSKKNSPIGVLNFTCKGCRNYSFFPVRRGENPDAYGSDIECTHMGAFVAQMHIPYRGAKEVVLYVFKDLNINLRQPPVEKIKKPLPEMNK